MRIPTLARLSGKNAGRRAVYLSFGQRPFVSVFIIGPREVTHNYSREVSASNSVEPNLAIPDLIYSEDEYTE